MKRLVRRAFDTTVYHGTTLSKLKQITQAGQIMPNETLGGGANGAPDENFLGFSFFATTVTKAEFYAEDTRNYEVGAVIEIALPESAILPDDNDMPSAKTWKDSANSINQVKVSGAVTDNYFKAIRFYDPETNEMFLECPFQGWEQKFAETEHGQRADSNKQDNEEYHQEFLSALQGMGITVQDGMMVNRSMADYINILAKYYSEEEWESIATGLYQGDVYVVAQGFDVKPPGDEIENYLLEGSNEIELVEAGEDTTAYLAEQYKQNPSVFNNLKLVFPNVMILADGDEFALEQLETWVMEDLGEQMVARLKRKREVN